ncbi:hypothetical protein [Zobellia galactanivorans]|uniref:hypothetical protein n=1 Tax=Zobellia galactanivorans (strain DSM 12802 / CCUG 47099 / CIP 106680 / NCIMB 13871 / Dsij) TaxID=63186 RepID=UPI001C0696E5|nr:hypothetical protein [Zobellia galactanivorans]MBU3024216.1 hypothetical protein [Zobellia galactanivorans]
MEGLECLLQVYAIGEVRYTERAVSTKNPLIRTFMERCALERSDFIMDIWQMVIRKNQPTDVGGLLAWHKNLYGKDYLITKPLYHLNIASLDQTAFEICQYMMLSNLSEELIALFIEQAVKLEVNLFTLKHFKILSRD